MVNENFIPQTETVYEVYELKNEIPTYEEFLKNYKVDERVKTSYESEIDNYGKLEKGYGPCVSCVDSVYRTVSNGSTEFKLEIRLVNVAGAVISQTVYSVKQARDAIMGIRYSRDDWGGSWSLGFFSGVNRERLVSGIIQLIDMHEKDGDPIDTTVSSISSW